MRVRGQETDNLLAGDAHADGAADGLSRDFAGDHVGVTRLEVDEELEDGNLQLGGGVGVDTVVCLDDDEAVAVGGTEGVVEAGGYRAQSAGIGGESGGEAGGVKARGGGAGLVDDAEVTKVFKHLELSRCEGGFAVVLAEFEAAEHEEEGEDVDGVHSEL